jgi:hypothetical protein
VHDHGADDDDAMGSSERCEDDSVAVDNDDGMAFSETHDDDSVAVNVAGVIDVARFSNCLKVPPTFTISLMAMGH